MTQKSLKEPAQVSNVSAVIAIYRAFRERNVTRVTEGKFFTGKIGCRMISPAVLFTIAAIVLSYQCATSTIVTGAQKPPRQMRSRPGPGPPDPAPAKIASNFNHESHRAPRTNLNCAECHRIALREAPDEIVAATKSSIKGFPYHDSCLGCHRRTPPQFFSGATPTICNVCHTRSSPRLTPREVYRQFPKQTDLTSRQLPGYFPHNQHRRVISDLKKVADLKQVSCADCHRKDERTPVALLVGGDEKSLTPGVGTFHLSPDLPNDPHSAHAYCFDCHWESDDEKKKPSRTNCAGCHLTQKEFAQKKSSLLLPDKAAWFKDWPQGWPRRLSLKFLHQRKEHVAICTACHARLVETETLNVKDVSIASCIKCHKSEKPKIFDEMEAEDEDSNVITNSNPVSKIGKHTCLGCHTTLIGTAPPPCSHYKLDEAKYLTGDFPKVSERCKE